MSDPFAQGPAPDVSDEPSNSEAGRSALVRQAQALQQSARETRAESREIVARCVEGRITREDLRSR